jgi:RNA polymerase sigma factor (sigma-70 family)
MSFSVMGPWAFIVALRAPAISSANSSITESSRKRIRVARLRWAARLPSPLGHGAFSHGSASGTWASSPARQAPSTDKGSAVALTNTSASPGQFRVFAKRGHGSIRLCSVSTRSFYRTTEAEIPPRRPTIEELYAENAAEAMRLAYLLTGDPDLAQDLAHDAFIRVVGRYQHITRPDSFGNYLRSSVVNACRDHFRRQERHREILRHRRPSQEDNASYQPDWAERDRFLQLLHALPTRQRIAVVLRYYEDLSEQQVADAMNCSLRAARSLITRAIQNLRVSIDSQEGSR